MCPLDYSLCNRTVTVYLLKEGQVHRRVAEGVFYSWKDILKAGRYGPYLDRTCLLITPGDSPICPGDRIFEGIGPEEILWETFLPLTVPGLAEVSYATPVYWEGELCHWEAGRN